MKTIPCIGLFVLAIACLAATDAAAQNIRNDTILVSSNAVVELKFSDKKSGGRVLNGDGSYEIGGNKKSVTVRATKKDTKPQWLVVTDGPRTHRFVLMYTDNLPPSKMIVDWSDLKNLREHVRAKQENAGRELEKANALYNQREWLEALKKYNWLKEEVEEGKTTAVEARIGDVKKELQSLYTNAVSNGDQLLSNKNYKEAWDAYRKALTYLPSDSAALKKSMDVTGRAFGECIRKASAANSNQNYLTAKMHYEEAREVDEETFRKNYVKAYEDVVKRANNQLYEKLMAAGDEAAELKAWESAKVLYDSAAKLKTGDPVATKKSKNAENELVMQVDLRKREAEYYGVLSRAKLLAGRGVSEPEISAAIAEYEKASKLFPDRKFPKDRIADLKKLGKTSSVKR